MHGTFLGKTRIKPLTYVTIPKNNNLIKFGSSTRLYILHLPEEKNFDDSDEEEDEDLEKSENPNSKKNSDSANKPNKKKNLKRKKKESKPRIEEYDEQDEDFAALTQHNEFYKSMYAKDDYDAFFDRTDRIEKRREMKKKAPNQIETYETLVAKQKIVMAQMKSLENDILELEKSSTESSQQSNTDELDSFMSQLNVTLQKEKITRKKKLLLEFKGDYDRLCSLSKIVKPALSGLSDASNFTEIQLKIISQFEEELKKKKSDTDNDTRDRSAEKRQQIHEQMKNMAKTSRGKVSSQESTNQLNLDQSDPSFKLPSSDISPNTDSLDSRSFNVLLPEDFKEESLPTYQPSLLSGVAEAIEKQNKEEQKRERESMEDEDDNPNTTKTKKKKKKKTTFDQDHQNYDSWEPPEGQTGDGRTYLNEKFGY